jgi:hypothetical protein
MSDRTLTGEIVFAGDRPFADASARVTLEDVSRVDAASSTIAEQVIAGVSFDPTVGGAIPFALSAEIPDEGGSYVVRVHVDVDGDGQVSPGDYLSMESFPVLTHGKPDRITVPVREVR